MDTDYEPNRAETIPKHGREAGDTRGLDEEAARVWCSTRCSSSPSLPCRLGFCGIPRGPAGNEGGGTVEVRNVAIIINELIGKGMIGASISASFLTHDDTSCKSKRKDKLDSSKRSDEPTSATPPRDLERCPTTACLTTPRPTSRRRGSWARARTSGVPPF